LDADTVALVRKTVANYAVSHTDVVKGKLSDGSIATLLTRPGNAEVAIQSAVMALVAQDGVSLADARTGVSQQIALPMRTTAMAAQSSLVAAPAALTPQIVVTNATTVQL